MGWFLHSPKRVKGSGRPSGKQRQNSLGISPYHRRLALEALEVRTLLAAAPLNVALISDAVAQAQQVRAAAAPGTIAIVYPSATMTTAGLDDLLASVCAAHNGDPIANLAIVAHGSSGEIDLGKGNVLSLVTLPGQSAALVRLRSVFTSDACLDLYSCSVAAGAEGRTFLEELAIDTGASVFASDHPVGTIPGADLTWDYNTGYPSASTELFTNEIKAIPRLYLGSSPTTTTLADPANPSAVGQSVTFTATVNPVYGGMGVPSGTVTFEDNGVSMPGNSTVPVGGGVVSSTASFSISTLTAGSHSITAVYNGDATFGVSTSTVDSHVADGKTTVTGVSSTTAAGTYGVGTVIPITVTFSGKVCVTATPQPQLTLNDGAVVNYTGGSGSSTLTFTYTVAAGQNAADLDYASTAALAVPNGGSIKDQAGNAAVLTLPATGTDGLVTKKIVIATPPIVGTVSTTSASNLHYKAGAKVPITVTFNRAVKVSGTPQLTLNDGGVARYSGGSGTATLTFIYTVAAGQNTANLDYATTALLALPRGASIKDVTVLRRP